MKNRRPHGPLALVLAFLVACSPILIATSAQAAATVDLVAQLQVPANAGPGAAFTMTGTIQSVGESAADGSTFTVQLAPGTTNVAAVCATNTGGAACATNIVVTPGTSSTGPLVTGSLPTMPRNSAVSITITGSFPSTSSAKTVLTAIVPTGAVDSGPSTNVAEQSTTLRASANVTVTKTEDKSSVTIGEARTYTVTYRNNGSSDLVGLPVRDWIAPNLEGGTASFSVSCQTTATSAECPSWAGGKTQTAPTYSGSSFYLYSGQIDLRSGEEVVLTIPFTIDFDSCVPQGEFEVRNEARWDAMSGVDLTGTAEAVVNSKVTGEPCPSANLVFTKTQSPETPVALGETRTYTVTYRNEGPSDVAGVKIRDWIAPNFNNGMATYSIGCVETPTSIECPSWANGAEQTRETNVGRSFDMFNGEVDIPSGQQLILAVPFQVASDVCVRGGAFEVQNVALRGEVPGVTISGSGYQAVVADVTGPDCPTAAVKVIHEQDLDSVALGEERTYSVTYRNDGPADITGMNVRDWAGQLGPTLATASFAVTCDEAASTAECPSWATGEARTADAYPSGSFYLYQGPLDLLVGEQIVLRIPLTITMDTCVPGGTFDFVNNAVRDRLDSLTITGNDVVPVTGAVTCVDVSTVTQFSEQQPAPRAPLTASTTISNSQGTARNIPVVMSLPADGFRADGESMLSCTPAESAACPNDLRYDAASHSLRGTILAMTGGETMTLSIAGTAGIVPPRTNSYIARTAADVTGQGDPTPASNNSTDSFGIANSQTTLIVTQAIDRAAPVDLVFTGVVSCEVQDVPSFTVSIAAGAMEGRSQVTDALWLHDDCTVTMSAPAAPAAHAWGAWEPADSQTATAITGPVVQNFALELMHVPEEVALPVLSVTDPCGLGNAVYELPADTAKLSWTYNADGTVTATLAEGIVFPDGTTAHVFAAPADSGVPCEIAVPAVPAISDPCGPNNATFLLPNDGNGVAWARRDDGSVIATAGVGTAFPGGVSTHVFPAPVDSGVACPTTPVEPTDPPTTPVEPTDRPTTPGDPDNPTQPPVSPVPGGSSGDGDGGGAGSGEPVIAQTGAPDMLTASALAVLSILAGALVLVVRRLRRV